MKIHFSLLASAALLSCVFFDPHPAFAADGPKVTTETLRAALTPEALYPLAIFKIGQTVPEEAKGKNEGPGYCPETWQPSMRKFTGFGSPYSDTTNISCNSKNDANILLGTNVWANKKTNKISQIDFLIQEKRVAANSPKEMDALLGDTVIINSQHPDVKKPLGGSKGFFYFNKLEPNLLFVHEISGAKKLYLTQVTAYDCKENRGTLFNPVCAKLGLK